MPPNRSEYQPLAQAAEDEEEDVSEGLAPQRTRGLRRAQRPVHIDLSKLDTAFKRYAFILALFRGVCTYGMCEGGPSLSHRR